MIAVSLEMGFPTRSDTSRAVEDGWRLAISDLGRRGIVLPM